MQRPRKLTANGMTFRCLKQIEKSFPRLLQWLDTGSPWPADMNLVRIQGMQLTLSLRLALLIRRVARGI